MMGFMVYYLWPLGLKKGDYSDNIIAHGGGIIDGFTYTNSLEAVMSSIKKGYKYIELDLQFTADSQLVCMHSVEDFRKMTNTPDTVDITYQYFKSQKLYKKYTPISANDAATIFQKNNITLVTDKISSPEILEKYFSNIKHNVMVEAFSLKDYQGLKKLGYMPMLGINSNGIKRLYILQCIKNKAIIDRITTTANKKDIKNYRFLKKMFGVKITIFTRLHPSTFKENLGHEIDYIYIDDKNNIIE